ncbi:MAG: glycosyl transferase family 1, partial [Myxococcales bacterium]|nr:glycosyl transferase family 1 [Myxococcales bacterium]
MTSARVERVSVERGTSLDDYATAAHLMGSVTELRREAMICKKALRGRKVVMLNSTAHGGGVAEMLPKLVSLLSELDVTTEWWVLKPEEEAFFPLTKRIHNLLHGSGDPSFSSEDRAMFERVSEDGAKALRHHIGPDDVVVVHDPQPVG